MGWECVERVGGSCSGVKGVVWCTWWWFGGFGIVWRGGIERRCSGPGRGFGRVGRSRGLCWDPGSVESEAKDVLNPQVVGDPCPRCVAVSRLESETCETHVITCSELGGVCGACSRGGEWRGNVDKDAGVGDGAVVGVSEPVFECCHRWPCLALLRHSKADADDLIGKWCRLGEGGCGERTNRGAWGCFGDGEGSGWFGSCSDLRGRWGGFDNWCWRRWFGSLLRGC